MTKVLINTYEKTIFNPHCRIWERYGIRGAGEVFLVDRDGTILAIGITAEEIERILKEKL